MARVLSPHGCGDFKQAGNRDRQEDYPASEAGNSSGLPGNRLASNCSPVGKTEPKLHSSQDGAPQISRCRADVFLRITLNV